MLSQESSLLFVSYSHKDVEFVERIRIHLKPLIDLEQVELWVDKEKIAPSDFWKEKINTALARMAMGVILISADYLASDFIKTFEIPAFLEAAKKGAKIFVLIAKPSLFEQTELAQLQTVNDLAHPLIGADEKEREYVFVKLAQQIGMALLQRQRKPATGVVSMNDQQDKLDFAIQNLLNTHEKYFLMALGSDKTSFEFQNNSRDRDHLRRLRDLEFIEKIGNKNIADLKRGENLKQLLRITDKGRTYLRYLEG